MDSPQKGAVAGGSAAAQTLFTIKPAGASGADVKTLLHWQPVGNYVAVASGNRVIQIFDRYGEVVDDVALTAGGNVLQISWDCDGEVLAILQSGNTAIVMWDAAQRKTLAPLETNMKDLCWMQWSQKGPELAVGSGKGNLIIFNRRTMRMNPLLGKHSKKISCGAWNEANQLALASDDKTVSLNTDKGDLVFQDSMKGEPTELQFSEPDGSRNQSVRMSVCLNRKSLYVKTVSGEVIAPLDLNFNAKRGDIGMHRWVDCDSFLVGFSSGFVMGVSTHKDSPGKELFGTQMFKFAVTGLDICQTKRRAAVCGENTVTFIDLVDWKELHDEKIVAPGLVKEVQWTSDGNFLSVVITDGRVLTYLMSMPVVHAHVGSSIAYMKSLRQVLVRDVLDVQNKKGTLTIEVDTEPDLMAMSGQYVAMAKNDICWIYLCDKQSSHMMHELNFNSTIDCVRLNKTSAAVLNGGQVNLQLTTGDADGKHSRCFPEQGDSDDSRITSVRLTEDFLICGTQAGTIYYESLADKTRASEFRHITGIKALWSNPLGTRLIVQDLDNSGFVYSPVNSTLLPLPDFLADTREVLWDIRDVGVFVVVGETRMDTYKYMASSLREEQFCKLVVSSETPATRINPIVLINGEMHFQTTSGSIGKTLLESHQALRSGAAQPADKFTQALALLRLEDAFALASAMDDPAKYEELRTAALEMLDISTALRVSQCMGDCHTVLALEPLVTCEDRNLLGGHIAMFLRDYELAQDLLLSSSQPRAALKMRCSLREWDKALRLAETLAPEQTPEICLNYAEHLQAQAEYEHALQRFEQALEPRFSAGGHHVDIDLGEEHVLACRAGMAKMHLKLGNRTDGIKLAIGIKEGIEQGDMKLPIECGDKVCIECAQILDSKPMGAPKGWCPPSEAAMLYEKGGNFEQAAHIYIKNKDLRAAELLMDKVGTPKLHKDFAKVKEKQGQYREAADAYEKGRDTNNLVRMCLEHLQLPQRAFSLVRGTRDTKSAHDIAKYCLQNADYRSAIEFHLIAKENDKAREVAKEHDLMDSFALFLGNDGSRAEYTEIAKYYVAKKNLEKAAEFFEKSRDYREALELFLKVGEKALSKAIDVVGAARHEHYTQKLTDYLMGEHDGNPKDPNWLYRMHLALGDYRQAARTQVIIAKQEQEQGNYKVAHKLLHDTFKELESQNVPVGRGLEEALMLLHSYVLVKMLVKQGDHDTGARLLVRVSNNISKFPAHVVPILTSTVIECQRAGLKRTSFEYASMLMRPEYRPQIAEAYKKKIESIVRKPVKTEEDEPASPCPYCGAKSPNSQLDCPQCKNRVPYCIATGLKMTVEDWCHCPSCRFPALYSKFTALIEAEKVCPMCDQEIVMSSISKVSNPEEYLKAIKSRSENKENA